MRHLITLMLAISSGIAFAGPRCDVARARYEAQVMERAAYDFGRYVRNVPGYSHIVDSAFRVEQQAHRFLTAGTTCPALAAELNQYLLPTYRVAQREYRDAEAHFPNPTVIGYPGGVAISQATLAVQGAGRFVMRGYNYAGKFWFTCTPN